MNDEHFLRIVSEPEDLLQIDDKLVDFQVSRVVLERAMNEGITTDTIMRDDLIKEVRTKLKRSGPNRYAKILKGYYKDKIGDIIVLIDNEKKDTAKMANNTLQFFQLIQDPAVLNDPVNRLFVTNYAREIGIDTSKMEMAFARRESMPQVAPPGQVPATEPQEAPEDPSIAEVL